MAEWPLDPPSWTGPMSNEVAKQAVADALVTRVADGDVVGVGSGSTAYLAAVALGALVRERGLDVTAVPTSYEAARTCAASGLRVASLAHVRPDWAFDGADEVDKAGRALKGRGGAMLREKLVFAAATERHLLVDATKLVDRLGASFAIPVEVVPEAAELVMRLVRDRLPVRSVTLRPCGGGKDGPVITEAGNLVLDVAADDITEATEDVLVHIPGVVVTGLFVGMDWQLHIPGS